MATTLLAKMAQESQDKTAHHAMLNAQIVVASVRNAVSARNAAGAASVAAAQSVAENAPASMPIPMPMSKAIATPMRAGRVVGKARTSAGQTATHVSKTQCKRALLPTR